MLMQKILIIEDHEMIIKNLINILEGEFAVVVATTAIEMRTCLQHESFDLALLDLELRDGSVGIENLAELSTISIPVLIFSGTATDDVLRACLNFNLCGFVDKHTGNAERVLAAVHGALAGFLAFPKQLLVNLKAPDGDGILKLTIREKDVLYRLLLRPTPSNKLIGEVLHLSTGRIRNLISSLLTKFKVKTRHDLILAARQRGYYPQHIVDARKLETHHE